MASRFVSYSLLAASMSLVGIYVALSKPLTAAIPVFVLAFLRFAIAAAAMAPFTGAARGELPLSRTEHRLMFLQSFFGNFLFSICMLTGISLTSATAAGVVLASLPAVVALLSWLFLREPLSWRVLAAIALACLGIALLHTARAGNEAAGGHALLGNLLIFGSVLCEATYVIIGKRLTATRTALRVSAITNLWGLTLITPFGLWQMGSFHPGGLSAAMWALLVFYSITASLIAVWLWLTGLKHVPANHAGVFTVALPLAATAVGVLFLGERLGVMHVVALGCAIAGVLLVTLAPGAPARAAA